MMKTVLRHSQTDDLAAIFSLLDACSLPRLGVEDHIHNFLVAEEDGTIVGVIGLEFYGEISLLRSAAVTSAARGEGIGTLLFDSMLSSARKLGVRKIILLTNTAEIYFQKKGFRKVDPQSITGPIKSSVEFSGACPSHSVCMELQL